MARANVAYVKQELRLMLTSYTLIRDVLIGRHAIQSARTKYLPVPNSDDQNPDTDNKARYASYLERAVFYAVTKRTLSGLVGRIFVRKPQLKLPPEIAFMENDATGSGLNLTQLAKRALMFTLAYGRVGLYVDYPDMDGRIVTQAQINAIRVRPTIAVFQPWDVINWRKVSIGGVVKLSLVVIQETYVASDDGFEAKEAQQFRVLRLIDMGLSIDAAAASDNADNVLDADTIYTNIDIQLRYQVEIWRKTSNGMEQHQIFWPRDRAGNYLDYIPFGFIGSENNDSDIDNPPLFDMADLNIAHYRNSADYEESAFMVGQPTPVATGLTENWVATQMKKVFQLGSRAFVPLPVGANAFLLQASPNGLAKEAMDTKERQMVALGAKLVEQRTVQRTAAEYSGETASETSTLLSCAQNVSHALIEALKWATNYVGGNPDGVEYSLNQELDLSKMAPDEIRAIIQAWQAHALAKEEMRDTLRLSGYAKLEDKEFDAAITAEIEADIATMGKLNASNPEPIGGAGPADVGRGKVTLPAPTPAQQ